jgi:hypothetical protein
MEVTLGRNRLQSVNSGLQGWPKRVEDRLI